MKATYGQPYDLLALRITGEISRFIEVATCIVVQIINSFFLSTSPLLIASTTSLVMDSV